MMYLVHHGIQGQRWGVRNGPPYPLSRQKITKEKTQSSSSGSAEGNAVNRSVVYGGKPENSKYVSKLDIMSPKLDRASFREPHSLPKGTKIYRVAAANEPIGKNTYATYTDVDRNAYKGIFYNQLQMYRDDNGKKPKLYEAEYVLKDDINVPGREELYEVYDKVMGDLKNVRAVGKSMVDRMFDKNRDIYWQYYDDTEQEMINDTFKKTKKIVFPSHEEIVKKTDEAVSKLKDVKIDQFVKDYKNMSNEDKYGEVAWSLGSQESVKNQIIQELKNRGYNAMTDEAGVGGNGGSRDGLDPLIIFDTDVLNKKNEKEIKESDWNKAYKKSYSWYEKVNKKDGDW